VGFNNVDLPLVDSTGAAEGDAGDDHQDDNDDHEDQGDLDGSIRDDGHDHDGSNNPDQHQRKEYPGVIGTTDVIEISNEVVDLGVTFGDHELVVIAGEHELAAAGLLQNYYVGVSINKHYDFR